MSLEQAPQLPPPSVLRPPLAPPSQEKAGQAWPSPDALTVGEAPIAESASIFSAEDGAAKIADAQVPTTKSDKEKTTAEILADRDYVRKAHADEAKFNPAKKRRSGAKIDFLDENPITGLKAEIAKLARDRALGVDIDEGDMTAKRDLLKYLTRPVTDTDIYTETMPKAPDYSKMSLSDLATAVSDAKLRTDDKEFGKNGTTHDSSETEVQDLLEALAEKLVAYKSDKSMSIDGLLNAIETLDKVGMGKNKSDRTPLNLTAEEREALDLSIIEAMQAQQAKKLGKVALDGADTDPVDDGGNAANVVDTNNDEADKLAQQITEGELMAEAVETEIKFKLDKAIELAHNDFQGVSDLNNFLITDLDDFDAKLKTYRDANLASLNNAFKTDILTGDDKKAAIDEINRRIRSFDSIHAGTRHRIEQSKNTFSREAQEKADRARLAKEAIDKKDQDFKIDIAFLEGLPDNKGIIKGFISGFIENKNAPVTLQSEMTRRDKALKSIVFNKDSDSQEIADAMDSYFRVIEESGARDGKIGKEIQDKKDSVIAELQEARTNVLTQPKKSETDAEKQTREIAEQARDDARTDNYIRFKSEANSIIDHSKFLKDAQDIVKNDLDRIGIMTNEEYEDLFDKFAAYVASDLPRWAAGDEDGRDRNARYFNSVGERIDRIRELSRLNRVLFVSDRQNEIERIKKDLTTALA